MMHAQDWQRQSTPKQHSCKDREPQDFPLLTTLATCRACAHGGGGWVGLGWDTASSSSAVTPVTAPREPPPVTPQGSAQECPSWQPAHAPLGHSRVTVRRPLSGWTPQATRTMVPRWSQRWAPLPHCPGPEHRAHTAPTTTRRGSTDMPASTGPGPQCAWARRHLPGFAPAHLVSLEVLGT